MAKQSKPRLEPTRSDAIETRYCLIDSAGQVFAEKGFQRASLRDICDIADVNLGSIKYYFGSKKALYHEVLLESHRKLLEAESMPRLEDASNPQAALLEWIRFVLRFSLAKRAAHPYIGQILRNEVLNPTEALDDLIAYVLQPVRDELERIVRILVTKHAPQKSIQRMTHFIVLLCFQQEMARPLLDRFNDIGPKTNKERDTLANQIFNFSLGGINQICKMEVKQKQ